MTQTPVQTSAPAVNRISGGMQGSEILRIAYEVQGLIAQGRRIANFTIGDFDPATFHIPAELKAAILDAYENGQTNYPQAMGNPMLRQAIGAYYEAGMGLSFAPDEIAVGSGIRPLIYAAFMTVVEPGESVVYGLPAWNTKSYVYLSRAADCGLPARPEDNFLLTADRVRPYLPEAGLLALCSPSNPSGTMYDRPQLEAICDAVLEENERRKAQNRKPLYVLYDQVYWKYAHSREHVHPVGLRPEMKAYTIYADGLSKSFSATGLRVGWCAGPRQVVHHIADLVGFIGAWAPKPEQLGAARYLTMIEEQKAYLLEMGAVMYERLRKIDQAIAAMKERGLPIDCIAPQGGLFLSIRCDLIGATAPDGSRIETAEQARRYLLLEGGCAFVPFFAFDAPESREWFRASVSSLSDADIDFGLAQLETALHALKF